MNSGRSCRTNCLLVISRVSLITPSHCLLVSSPRALHRRADYGRVRSKFTLFWGIPGAGGRQNPLIYLQNILFPPPHPPPHPLYPKNSQPSYQRLDNGFFCSLGQEARLLRLWHTTFMVRLALRWRLMY